MLLRDRMKTMKARREKQLTLAVAAVFNYLVQL